MSEIVFAQGMFFAKPSEKAPEFVLGKISIKRIEFLEWLDQQTENDKGYVNLDVLMGKSGKPYVKLDNFVPKQRD